MFKLIPSTHDFFNNPDEVKLVVSKPERDEDTFLDNVVIPDTKIKINRLELFKAEKPSSPLLFAYPEFAQHIIDGFAEALDLTSERLIEIFSKNIRLGVTKKPEKDYLHADCFIFIDYENKLFIEQHNESDYDLGNGKFSFGLERLFYFLCKLKYAGVI